MSKMNDGKKKKPQKHQNKTAFKILFDPLAINHQKKVSLSLLCKRCSDQISWKLQFNKYRKITQASKCNYCHDKVVVRSYMKACDKCAQKEGVCPKCLNKDADMPEEDQVKLSAKEQAEKDKQDLKIKQQYFDSLRERSKRKVLRQEEKDLIQWSTQLKCFVDKEGNQLTGLKFKSKGLDDLEKEMGDDEDDDDQQIEESDEGKSEQEKTTQLKNKGKAQKKKQTQEKSVEKSGSQKNDQDWEDQQVQYQDQDEKSDEDNDNSEEEEEKRKESQVKSNKKDQQQQNQQQEEKQLPEREQK